MKQGLFFTGIGVALIALLWYTFGAVAVLAVIGAFLGLGVLLAVFSLGSLWTKRTMEAGANIALQAQISDDKRDTIQTKALTDLMKAALSLKGQMVDPSQLDEFQRWKVETSGGSGQRALPAGRRTLIEEVFDGDFRIEGGDQNEFVDANYYDDDGGE